PPRRSSDLNGAALLRGGGARGEGRPRGENVVDEQHLSAVLPRARRTASTQGDRRSTLPASLRLTQVMVAPAAPLQHRLAPGGHAHGDEACGEFPRKWGNHLVSPPASAPSRGSRNDDERRPGLPGPPEPRPQVPGKAVQRPLQVGAVPG